MKVNIEMIKKKDLELFIGMMEKFIKDIGKMENNVEKENSIIQEIIRGEKDVGIMAKKLNGIENILRFH